MFHQRDPKDVGSRMWSLHKWKKYRILTMALTLSSALIFLTAYNQQLIVKKFGYLAQSVRGVTVMRMATMRQNLTFFTNASNGIIPPEANELTAEEIYHRYGSEIQVRCPRSLRLGNRNDGGWDVCIYSAYKPQKKCLVYSFGINNEWSFDDSVVANYNCTVRAFDPSMQASDHRRGKHIWFYKQGISGSDFVNSRGWKLRTLESFVRMFNESEKMIDYLKIDVEYSEWSSLEAILNTTVLSKVKQFGLETHTKEVSRKASSSVADLVYYSGLLRRLHDAGFYRWYWHFNQYGKFVSKHSHRQLTCCFEMVFLNVNIPYVAS